MIFPTGKSPQTTLAGKEGMVNGSKKPAMDESAGFIFA
jgi:hypothetical protein